MEGVRDELNARDVIIARLEAEPDSLIPGLKENNDAIANLELKLIGVITELKDQETLITELGDELSKANLKLEAKDRAISAIKSGLAVKGGDKQLNLSPPELTPIQTPEPEPIPTPELTPNPTPELTPEPTPEPEPIPKPESNPDQTDTTGTVDRSGLLEFINKNFPDDKIKPKQITNAVYRNGVGLSKLESKYGFKFVGTTENGNQFKLI